MELHKQGYTNKEIAEITGKSLKSIEHLLHRARNPRIHEVQGHYKKIITALDEDISIRGKYMSVTMKSLLSNTTLSQGDLYQNESPKTYNLFEFLYHNILYADFFLFGDNAQFCGYGRCTKNTYNKITLLLLSRPFEVLGKIVREKCLEFSIL